MTSSGVHNLKCIYATIQLNQNTNNKILYSYSYLRDNKTIRNKKKIKKLGNHTPNFVDIAIFIILLMYMH